MNRKDMFIHKVPSRLKTQRRATMADSNPKKRLEGKVAIITGAASGIGEAATRLFAQSGAYVVIADIQDELGHHVATSIGLNCASYIHCDVSDELQVKAAIDWTLAKFGHLDIMFSNAGIGGSRACPSILHMDMAHLNKILTVNVRGMAAAIKHAGRAMVSQGTRGSIICTASVSSVLGGVALHDYTMSKHAIVGLVKSAASELGKHGIRVNCISPYAVATPMLSSAFDEMGGDALGSLEQMISSLSNLKGVVLKAENVADAALFLATDDSSFVSGHNLVVDGGFTVVNHAFGIYK